MLRILYCGTISTEIPTSRPFFKKDFYVEAVPENTYVCFYEYQFLAKTRAVIDAPSWRAQIGNKRNKTMTRLIPAHQYLSHLQCAI